MSTIADIFVTRLRDAGARALFGMPGGGGNLDLIDAAGRAGLPFVLTAGETAGALAAVAQAELTEAPGACLTTIGPGVTSVANGVACAFLERAPLVVLTDSYREAAGGAYDHQRLDHRALLAPVTKWSAIIDPDAADATLAEAIERSLAGRPGPVHLDIPADVASATVRLKSDDAISREAAIARDAAIARAAIRLKVDPAVLDLCASARKPLLLVGLGARRPADAAAIRALCTRLGIPALVTYKAKGVVADGDPCFAGIFTNAVIEQPLLSQADLLIGVGLDPVELLPRPWTATPPIVACGRWRVDDWHVPFAAQCVGDIPALLALVAERLRPASWDLDDTQRDVEEQRRRISPRTGRLAPHHVVEIAAAAAAGVRVTVDAGAHMLPATMLWPIAEPNGLLISNGLSTMGFALPAAIGAALVDRSRPVVALTGDGGLMMCAGELRTAARERLRIVTVVFADASLSLIQMKQRQRKLAPAGMAMGDTDWTSVAEGFGAAAFRATTPPELETAMAAALAHDGPSLVEARIDPATYVDTLRAIRG